MSKFWISTPKSKEAKNDAVVHFSVAPLKKYQSKKGFSASFDVDAIEKLKDLVKKPTKTYVMFHVKDYINEYSSVGLGGMQYQQFMDWLKLRGDENGEYYTIWATWFK
jgi:hypothetical protein